MPIIDLEAVADAYVDEGAPESNFGTETVLKVRTELNANRRAYVQFDMDQVPDDFVEWGDIVDVIVQLVSTDHPTASNRVLDLEDMDASFEETGLTWNTQPNVKTGAIGNDEPATGDEIRFDLLGVTQIIPLSGPWPLRLKDDQEDDDSLEGPFEQECAAREHTSRQPAVFHAEYRAQRGQDLAASLTVRRSVSSDLAADVVPRIPAEADLDAVLDVVYVRDLSATVAPSLAPLGVRARVQGIVTRLFLEPLEAFRRISDEAGSLVSRVQDGETIEVRRIVQVVASGTPAFSLSETPTFPGTDTGTPDTLRRGDAILFALGDDRWEPGARVTWDDREYKVSGVLGVERIEDEVLYQEIGLRRLSVAVQGRAMGVVA